MANDTTHPGFNTLTTLIHPNHSPISAALTSHENHDIIEAAPAPACVTPPFSTSSSSCNGPSCSSTSSASSSTFDPISIDCSNEVSSSPPLRLDKGKVDPTIIGFKRAENGGLMRMQGLMKLRRQGSQPPCSLRNKQARELLASLQRLSLKEEAHNSLLLKNELEGSLVNNVERRPNLLGSKPELPFSAKIAAAMDADGLIGVEKHISDHNIADNQADQTQAAANHHIINSNIIALHSKLSKNRRCELSRGEKSGRRRSSIKRRSGWIVLRRLRKSRSLLGKIWKNIRRAFSSPSKRWLHSRELLKGSI